MLEGHVRLRRPAMNDRVPIRRVLSLGSRRLRFGWICCLLALLCCGGPDDPPGLRKHRDPDFSFLYPESWELTHDTFELETPDSRVLILRAPGDAVIMLHRFTPPLGWTLKEFVKEFSAQRSRRAMRTGKVRARNLRESSVSVAPRGRPLQGLRQEFVLEDDGVTSEQTSLFFVIERDRAQIFVSAHGPTRRISELGADLRTVLSSLRGGAIASGAAAQSPAAGASIVGVEGSPGT